MVIPEDLPAAAASLTEKMMPSRSKENNEDPGDILKALSPRKKYLHTCTAIYICICNCVDVSGVCLYFPK